MTAATRTTAARLLRQVLANRSSLNHLFDDHRNHPQISTIKALCFDACRYHHRLSRLTAILMEKPPAAKHADIDALIRIGLLELHLRSTPEHAVVSETVRSCHELGKTWAKGLVNAVLRRYLRERESLEKTLAEDKQYLYAHSQWMIDAIRNDWPHHWQRILEANNAQAPQVLRVNPSKCSREVYIQLCHDQQLQARAVPELPQAVILAEARPVDRIPGFADGLVSIQDGAAQLAADLLDLEPGQRLLDACAAPGGKTALIAERHRDLAITAVEKDHHRLGAIEENRQRLQLTFTVLHGDATRPSQWWDKTQFQRILVDAPCSGTGVIRRHPDIKLLRTRDDIRQLSALQLDILLKLWPLLQPGGILLYCTCSILHQENTGVVLRFLHQTADAQLLPFQPPWKNMLETGACGPQGEQAPGWQTLAGEHQMDGFYYAKIGKSPA